MGRGRARRAGFTLVELLVVIAIIVMLMAIAFPVFSRARERAKQAHCMANLHNIALAIRMYRIDEGAYPGPPDLVTGQGGVNALFPTYITSREGLRCPDDPFDNAKAYLAAKEFAVGGALGGVTYETFLTNSGSMYLWTVSTTTITSLKEAYFVDVYSSYNRYYNYYGYVRWIPRTLPDGTPNPVPGGTDSPDKGRDLRLLDQSLGTSAPVQHVDTGESLAFVYEWYRYDPEGKLNLNEQDPTSGCYYNRQKVDCLLGLDLARQIYWEDYPNATPNNNWQLQDDLGRPLWDYDETDTTGTGTGGLYPDGMPSAVFPGLVNRNAPDSTIVTRCPYHRPWTKVRIPVGPPPQGGKGQKRRDTTTVEVQQVTTGKDIALRLDGSAELVPVLNANYDWALQSAQTH